MAESTLPAALVLVAELRSIRESQANSGWMIEEDLEAIARAEDLLALFAAAERRGAETMREMAAMFVQNETIRGDSEYGVAAAIRALPTPAETEEKEATDEN